MFLQP